ncbi:MAG: aspartate kinase [bacterium]
MSIVVQKFGGTSVGTTDRIKNVAKAVIREYENGHQVVVVVSAMGHTTDYLVKLANDLTTQPSNREMDMLLSTGEQVSIALVAMAIQEMGYPAVSMVASQMGIFTEGVHSKARIVEIKADKIKSTLDKGNIVVAAGFQGITKDGEITTLGRGGSDTSAVALAAALKAERCDIYTDVDAIYTTDPRVVPQASRIDKITFEEMLELARVGAGVLHPRSVETAKQFNVPLRLRSSFKQDDLGTLIVGVDEMEIYRPVSGVAADLSQIRIVFINVPDSPGTAAKIFSHLAENHVSVDMIIQAYIKENNANNIGFTISESDFDGAEIVIKSILEEYPTADVVIDKDIAKVSIVGAGMIDRPGIAADMFDALAGIDVNIKMISTSEIKISCLVEKSRAHDAIRAIHTKFDLDNEGNDVEIEK